MQLSSDQFKPGMRVKITQTIPFGTRPVTTTVEGVIRRFGQQKTGSWFAHAMDNKLWLDRLEIEKEDGERVTINLDRFTKVESMDEAGV